MKKFAIALAALAVMAAVASAAVYSQNAVGFINVEVGAGELVALTIPFANMAADDGTWLFTDTQLATDAPNASTVYFWDGTGWAPVSKGKNGFKTEKKLAAGECFFFRPKSAMTVVMSGEVPDEDSTTVLLKGAGNLSAVGNPYPVPVKFTDTSLATKASNASTVYFWDGTGWAPVSKGKNGFKTEKELAAGEGFFFKTNKNDGDTPWDVEKPYDFP